MHDDPSSVGVHVPSPPPASALCSVAMTTRIPTISSSAPLGTMTSDPTYPPLHASVFATGAFPPTLPGEPT